MIDLNIDKAAAAHAAELNKSISDMGTKVSYAIVIGLSIIALAIRTKK